MEPEIAKELMNLQAAYKAGFDLVAQRVENQVKLLEAAAQELKDSKMQMDQLSELLKEIIAEKDVQIQKLIKASSAIVRVADQLTARFNMQE